MFVTGFPAIGQLLPIGLFNQQWLGYESTAFIGLVIVSVLAERGYVMVTHDRRTDGRRFDLIESARSTARRLYALLKVNCSVYALHPCACSGRSPSL